MSSNLMLGAPKLLRYLPKQTRGAQVQLDFSEVGGAHNALTDLGVDGMEQPYGFEFAVHNGKGTLIERLVFPTAAFNELRAWVNEHAEYVQEFNEKLERAKQWRVELDVEDGACSQHYFGSPADAFKFAGENMDPEAAQDVNGRWWWDAPGGKQVSVAVFPPEA